MGSVAQQTRDIANGIIKNCGYKTAVLSGIVGDAAHQARGGFHCSVLELRAHGNENDYSNTRLADRNQNIAYASAIDISLNPAEMVKAWGRVHAVWADRSDPRRVFVNAINGWDGSGDAARLDFDAQKSEYADPSHKFHFHTEIHRKYILSDQAARAVVSIYQGETKAAWIAREDPQPEEAVVPFTDDDKKWLTEQIQTAVKSLLADDADPSARVYSLGGMLTTVEKRTDQIANHDVPDIKQGIVDLKALLTPHAGN